MGVGWSATAIRSPVVVLGVEEREGSTAGARGACQPHLRLDCQRARQDDVTAQADTSLCCLWAHVVMEGETRYEKTTVLAGLCGEEKTMRWALQQTWAPIATQSGRWTSVFLPSNSHKDKRNAKESTS